MNKAELAQALKDAGIEPAYNATPDGNPNNVWYLTCHACNEYMHEIGSEPCETGVLEHRLCSNCGRVATYHRPFTG